MPKTSHPLRTPTVCVPPDTELISWLALQNHTRIDVAAVAGKRHFSVTVGNVNAVAHTLREALAEVKHLVEKRAFGEQH